MMRRMSRFLASALAALLLAVPGTALAATQAAHVRLDTSGLAGGASGPYSLDFQLVDGSGAGDANTTATISHLDFSSGAATDPPQFTGGGSGSASSAFTLIDHAFLNEIVQPFAAGATLAFDVQVTAGIDPGGQPDEFSFAILDRNGAEIATTGLGDSLLSASLDSSAPVVVTSAVDAARTPLLVTIAATIPGDVDGDGAVTASDLSRMLQILVGIIEPTAQDFASGDVRPKPGSGGRPFGDGRIGADDVNWVFRRFMGLETFP